MSCENFEEQLRVDDGEDLNSDLLNERFEPINSRICIIEDSLAFLGDIFGKGVFNLDTQLTPNAAFEGAVGLSTDEFVIDPGAAILKGFIFQITTPNTLSLFGLATGTYYIQLGSDGAIRVHDSNSSERVPLWKMDFDGTIQNIVDERIFVTNPKILLTELIESRKTNAFIVGVKGEPFVITTGLNDIFSISIDSKPIFTVQITPGTKTASDIANEINTALISDVNYGTDYDNSALDEDGHLKIISKLNGTGQITVLSGSANETLGFKNNESSLAIIFNSLDDRLDAKEAQFETDLKHHKSDTNIHHNKIHDINGSDHTGSLDESKISWDPINGHNHDGVNGAKVKFADLDITGVTNPFSVTLSEAEAAGLTLSSDPQIQQTSTYSSQFVNDLVDPLANSLSLEDDLNQIRSIIREIKDTTSAFNGQLLAGSSSNTFIPEAPISLKQISDILENITVGSLVDGLKIIPNTLPHSNLIIDRGNPHKSTLQEAYDSYQLRFSLGDIPPQDINLIKIQSSGLNNYLRLGSETSYVGFDVQGNITFSGSQTVDGVDISAHAADQDAHHPKEHSHNGTDGSGQLNLANLDTINQLPLSKVNDAQSATAFDAHDHDGVNSSQISYNNLLDVPSSFLAAPHSHSTGSGNGALDLNNLDATGQLSLSFIEGWDVSNNFTFPSSVTITNDLDVQGDINLGNNGTSIQVNSTNTNFESIVTFNNDVIIGNNPGDSFTIYSAATFDNEIHVLTNPSSSTHAVNKQYVDNAISVGGGGALLSGDNTWTGSFNNFNNNVTIGTDFTDNLTVNATTTFVNALSLSSTPTQNAHATRKDYVDNALADKLSVSGGAMTGFLTLNADPTNNLHAATKQYVDSQDATKLNTTGGTVTGNLTVQGDLIVQGSQTVIESNTVNIGDNELVLNEDITLNSQNSNGGVSIKRLDIDNTTRIDAKISWDETNDLWQIGTSSSLSNIVTELRLGSNSNGLGASLVGIEDPSGYITATDVEGALIELASELDTTSTNNTLRLNDLESATGTANGLLGLNYSSNRVITDNTSLSTAISDLDAGMVKRTGDSMTGFLTLNADPTSNLHAATKQYVDTLTSSNTTSINSHINDLNDAHDASAISFSNATSGLLAVNVQGAIDEVEGRLDTAETGISTNTTNISTNASNITSLQSDKVNKSGDTMTGFLTLNADPTSSLHAATKQYVDTAVSGVSGGSPYFDDPGTTPSAAPSATGVHSIAIGNGAIASGDSSYALGGNVSGQNSIAAIGGSAAANYTIAIGNSTDALQDRTIAIGYNNSANLFQSCAIGGVDNIASGAGSSVFGGLINTASGSNSLVSGGSQNIASASFSTVIGGTRGVADKYGQHTFSAGRFTTNGDAQTSQFVARIETTNATPTEMLLDGGFDITPRRLTLADNTTWMFEIHIVAKTASTDKAGYKVKGIIDRGAGAGSVQFIGSPVIETLAETNSGWDVDVINDTTNGALKIEVTGAASTTVRWVAFIRTTEVTF